MPLQGPLPCPPVLQPPLPQRECSADAPPTPPRLLAVPPQPLLQGTTRPPSLGAPHNAGSNSGERLCAPCIFSILATVARRWAAAPSTPKVAGRRLPSAFYLSLSWTRWHKRPRSSGTKCSSSCWPGTRQSHQTLWGSQRSCVACR